MGFGELDVQPYLVSNNKEIVSYWVIAHRKQISLTISHNLMYHLNVVFYNLKPKNMNLNLLKINIQFIETKYGHNPQQFKHINIKHTTIFFEKSMDQQKNELPQNKKVSLHSSFFFRATTNS